MDGLALDTINLDIEQGEFVVALGASGCGKTSLLNVLAGFLFTENGEVTINDQKVIGPGPDRGVVFQENALMPWLNVEDNICFGLKLKGVEKKELTEKLEQVLDWVDLSAFRKSFIYELSGGMQQRVGIARALAVNPEVLLMDEPLGALDAITRQEVQKVIVDLWDKTHKTIFMITHSIEEALFMGTRLVIMTPRPGRIHRIYQVDFAQKYLSGADPKTLKTSAEFISLKNEILALVEEHAS
jgi:taurine transport system ATP-binding protein